ncbi:MAG: DNA repair protein RadA [Rickettsiales bacterium]
MVKKNERYICFSCGAVHKKWQGQCPDCNEWNTIELEEVSSVDYSAAKSSGKSLEFENLQDDVVIEPRTETGIQELDRVLGSGLVRGSAILIGGDPGIGKSTLLLQLVCKLSSSNKSCLYITGEESLEQIRLRSSRLGLDNTPVSILSATNINDISASLGKVSGKVDLVIVDSIQTMFTPDISSAPGTVSQVRASAHELISIAKKKNITIVIVGHVTKEGQLAGPKILEHMVDTVLYFEGERGNNFRILRAVKNRYGGVNEIGVFEMQEKGLIEVSNPSELFLTERKNNVSGAVVYAGVEGTRPILVEIQALVAPSQMVSPRRAVVGWDLNRLSMMIAVLATRYGINLGNQEVYLNVVGGLKVNEPAADLPVICALISAMKNKALQNDTIIVGEVGLSGEVRKVSRISARLNEAKKLGFKNAIVPSGSSVGNCKLNISEIGHIKQLSEFF